jgi:hypothetical protein
MIYKFGYWCRGRGASKSPYFRIISRGIFWDNRFHNLLSESFVTESNFKNTRNRRLPIPLESRFQSQGSPESDSCCSGLKGHVLSPFNSPRSSCGGQFEIRLAHKKANYTESNRKKAFVVSPGTICCFSNNVYQAAHSYK